VTHEHALQARWRGVMGRAKMRRVREHRAKYLGEVARQEKVARESRVLVLQVSKQSLNPNP